MENFNSPETIVMLLTSNEQLLIKVVKLSLKADDPQIGERHGDV